ncbi:diguanylate cyclase (GGDEF) domain-containing protein [Paenibacillus sp. 1_12]|uniref:EAL domain-containing protein n=1 Tax=Paenibacillus sp. 1_12 TaxID=1566278 RepID=UPI0008F2B865|nr:EAL domain-containing protein [Paenibacillus sp. 1_12]SFL33020.1 diguanylate cyclase (GGDEF) domain-containing protein [Paenibacillus sp. 1_12]
MENWLLPATALMNRLNYMQKFFLIGLLLVLPCGLFITLLIGNINKEIETLSTERQGLEYIAKISQFIENVQQHRGMNNAYLHGEYSFEQQLISKRLVIEKDIPQLREANQRYRDTLQPETRFDQIVDNWELIKNVTTVSDANLSFALHSEIISQSIALIDHVSNTSGLKIDRHKESYYLFDGLIGKLLAMLEHLGQTRGIASGIAADKQLGMDLKTQLTVLRGLIRSALDIVKGSLTMIYEEAPWLQPSIKQQMDAIEQGINQFIYWLDTEIMTVSTVEIPSPTIYEMGTSSIHMGFELQHTSMSIIDHILQERIEKWARQRMMILAILTFACLVVAYLFLGLYRSVIHSVHALNHASSRLAEGDLTARVTLNSQDELLSVGKAYNHMAEAFESIWSERKAHEEQLKFRAYHDQLTGLPNRVNFQEQLQSHIGEAGRSNQMLAILFIDLDRFKIVNDTLGHKAGDLLLQTVANRLSDEHFVNCQVFRMGGDEFTAIIPVIESKEEAISIAERMLTILDQPIILDSYEMKASASIGISVYPSDGQTLQELLVNADMSMYVAKKQGSNGYQLYHPLLKEQAQRKQAMELELRMALERDEFSLYYQPRIQLLNGHFTTVEALIRWNHPELGLVAPSIFIPLAEETGLIKPIGEWVLRTACRQSNLWCTEGISDVKMAVNISGIQFQSEHFIQDIADILAESDFDPNKLEFELTESVVMVNVPQAISKMKQLRDQGIRISIDDFGTGFSSLSYLKYFPVDILKIDRSFVKDIPFAPKDTAITKTIIGLARRLGLEVVAEGVETEEQMAFLRSRNCNEAQGYLLSKPLPAFEMTALLKNHQLLIQMP